MALTPKEDGLIPAIWGGAIIEALNERLRWEIDLLGSLPPDTRSHWRKLLDRWSWRVRNAREALAYRIAPWVRRDDW